VYRIFDLTIDFIDRNSIFIFLFHKSYIKRSGGIAAEKDYPYVGDKYSQECYFNRSTKVEAKVKFYKWILPDNMREEEAFVNIRDNKPLSTEKAVAKAVATVGPIGTGLDATRFQHYRGGIFYNKHYIYDRLHITHAVIIVGYTETYWIIKNSWGKRWGDDGYIYIARDRGNQCGITSMPLYVVANDSEKP